MALLQNPEVLFCDSPVRACLRLHTASLSIMNISSTPKSAETYSQTTRQLAFQLGLAAKNSLAQRPTQTGCCPCHPIKVLQLYFRCGICCLQKLKRPTRCSVSSQLIGNARCNNLFFTLERLSQHAPRLWTHENLINVVGL